jgi:hypothetical protein
VKLRTMNVNGRTYLLEDDVRALLRPLGVMLTESEEPLTRAATPTAKPKATKKRRTKAELQAEVRKLEGEPLEAIAKKLGISMKTAGKLALVVKGEPEQGAFRSRGGEQ